MTLEQFNDLPVGTILRRATGSMWVKIPCVDGGDYGDVERLSENHSHLHIHTGGCASEFHLS